MCSWTNDADGNIEVMNAPNTHDTHLPDPEKVKKELVRRNIMTDAAASSADVPAPAYQSVQHVVSNAIVGLSSQERDALPTTAAMKKGRPMPSTGPGRKRPKSKTGRNRWIQ